MFSSASLFAYYNGICPIVLADHQGSKQIMIKLLETENAMYTRSCVYIHACYHFLQRGHIYHVIDALNPHVGLLVFCMPLMSGPCQFQIWFSSCPFPWKLHAAGLTLCCPILHYYIPSNWTTSIDLNQPGYYIYKYWWGYDVVAAGNLQASKQACCCTMHWWEIRWKVWNSLVLVQESGNLKRPFYLADSNERRHPKK